MSCAAFARLCACALCDNRTSTGHLRLPLHAGILLPRPSTRLSLHIRRTGSWAKAVAPAAAARPHAPETLKRIADRAGGCPVGDGAVESTLRHVQSSASLLYERCARGSALDVHQFTWRGRERPHICER